MKERKVLFAGHYCHPISPLSGDDDKDGSMINVSENDQLIKIITTIGAEDLPDDFFFKRKTIKYYKTIKNLSSKLTTVTIADQLKDLNPNLIKLVEQCIQFKPENRESFEVMLQNPIFAGIRN